MDVQTYYFVYYLVRFVIPLFINESLFIFYSKRRDHFWIRYACSFAFYILIVFFVTYFSLDIELFGWLRFNFLTIFLVSIIPILVCSKVSLKEAFFYGMASYTAQNLADNGAYLTLVACNISTYGYDSFIFFALFAILFTALFFSIFVYKFKEGNFEVLGNKYVYIFVVVTLLTVYLLSMYGGTSTTLSTDFISIRIYAIVCCLFLLVIQFNLFNLGFLHYQKETLSNLLEKEKMNYKLMKANMDAINIKTHDLKHQIAEMRKDVSDETKARALENLENEIDIYNEKIKSGNVTIDSILQDKKFYCDKHQIKLSCIVDGKLLDFMDPLDIYSLFGNALDNAIEAVLKAKHEERFITLTMKEKNNMIVIKMSNTCKTKVDFINGLPLTTKNTHEHGFGTRSIQYIAEKYNGKVQFKSENDIFTVNIFIPLR